MTANKRLKRLVRRRAAKTGESYTAALRHFRANPGEEPTVPSTKSPIANCSFCGKSNAEVKKIVAGPGVYICNDCVNLCNEVIAQVEEKPDTAAPRGTQPSPERVLEWLPSIGKTLRSVEADIARRAAALREEGVAWSRIAEALGMEESEAAERFSTSPDA